METGELRDRLLLLGRGLYLGALWGVGLGAAADVVLGLANASDGGLVMLFFIQIACCIGGIVGAASGLAGGAALALSPRWLIGRMTLARLVAGGAAALVPLAITGYLYRAERHWDWNGRLGVGLVASAAAVAAALLTPRVLHGSPPPTGAGLPQPARLLSGLPAPWGSFDPPVPAAPASLDNQTACDLPADDQLPSRRLVIGRSVGWGIIGGTGLGAFSWLVWCLQFGALKPLSLVGFAALSGAAVGGCLGLVAGLALALGGGWAVRSTYRAQLIAGGAVTVLLVALSRLGKMQAGWYLAFSLNPSLAVVAALAAVLLTPCIVTGMPARRSRSSTRSR